MAIYQHRRALSNQEIDALLTAWPTTDADGATVATHSDLVGEADFDSGKNEVNAYIATRPKLASAGISAASDAIAPQWCVVTLPADTQTDGTWSTTFEDSAKDIAEANTGDYIEHVVSVYEMETVTDGEGNQLETEKMPLVALSKSGVWRTRDRYDRWLGTGGYLAQIEAKL
tara:strand:+ start:193 stop:708 length:516 start_codon:yes stop_codon:yes gene_type:complete